MELAKITMRGQITLPKEIRKKLGVKDGDKVIFIEENGRIIIENAAMVALKKAQLAFDGEAERLNLKSESDVVNLVKDVRREIWKNSMRIMIDTNVLISALLFPNLQMNTLFSILTVSISLFYHHI
jgi:AbrB family looped-hinge helix DNA binding protein